MSKADFLDQLETLTEDELAAIAIGVDQLLQRAEEKSALTIPERQLLHERMKRFQADGNSGDDWSIVRERVLARFRK